MSNQFFLIAGTLQHVAKTAAHVDLSDHITNVVFVLFDENGQYLGSRSLLVVLPLVSLLYGKLVTQPFTVFSSITLCCWPFLFTLPVPFSVTFQTIEY